MCEEIILEEGKLYSNLHEKHTQVTSYGIQRTSNVVIPLTQDINCQVAKMNVTNITWTRLIALLFLHSQFKAVKYTYYSQNDNKF